MSIFTNNNAVERLDDRLVRLETLCADLDRQNKKLDLEFTDLYDRVKRQMSRMAKRYAVDQTEAAEDSPEGAPNGQFQNTDPISRSIMLRRARMGTTK